MELMTDSASHCPLGTTPAFLLDKYKGKAIANPIGGKRKERTMFKNHRKPYFQMRKIAKKFGGCGVVILL